MTTLMSTLSTMPLNRTRLPRCTHCFHHKKKLVTSSQQPPQPAIRIALSRTPTQKCPPQKKQSLSCLNFALVLLIWNPPSTHFHPILQPPLSPFFPNRSHKRLFSLTQLRYPNKQHFWHFVKEIVLSVLNSLSFSPVARPLLPVSPNLVTKWMHSILNNILSPSLPFYLPINLSPLSTTLVPQNHTSPSSSSSRSPFFPSHGLTFFPSHGPTFFPSPSTTSCAWLSLCLRSCCL